MERAGILDGDRPVELLHDGQIVVMTIRPPHAAAVSHLARRFQRALGDHAQVAVQGPLRLSDDMDDVNLPQPDLMLVADPEKVYADHPRPRDVYLLVEVSDTTLAKGSTRQAAPLRGARHSGSVDRGLGGPADRGPHGSAR